MIRVAAITGGRTKPSARFRIRQHINALKSADIEVRDYPHLIDNLRLPGYLRRVQPRYLAPVTLPLLAVNTGARVLDMLRSRSFDVVWINKYTIPGTSTLDFLLPSPRVLDIDDAIWMQYPTVQKSVQNVDVAIAGNSFLANWLGQFCKEVHIVPTAIDTDRYRLRSTVNQSNDFVVGWTGTIHTLKYLESLEAPLYRFLLRHPKSKIMVLCDHPPKFKLISTDRLDFRVWTPENEVRIVQEFDVGIMPLQDTAWERGKCSFKMLQYMSCGVPVVVSPVGMNKDILAKGDIGLAAITEGEWYDALSYLCEDVAARKVYGAVGRRLAEKCYSVNVISKQLAEIFIAAVK